MQLFALTIGDSQVGSTRFRVMQYHQLFEQERIELLCQEKSAWEFEKFKVGAAPRWILNQKCLLPISVARRFRHTGIPLLFDFDDAIYTRPGRPFSWWAGLRVKRRWKAWLKAADLVTVANQYLAERAQLYAQRVEVVPMSLDLQVWHPRSIHDERIVRVGWAGAPHNLHHLEALAPVLKEFLTRAPQVKLCVFSGRRPVWDLPYEYTPFEPGADNHFIQGLDIGLLPLSDEPYSRGKSPIKALQYLACGVPVVGNVYGATREICLPEHSIAIQSTKDWLPALKQLVDDVSYRRMMGAAGRLFIEKNHNAQKVGTRFIQLLHELG